MRKSVKGSFKDFKIIVVDDEKGILDSVSTIVKRLGYICTGMSNPIEAIDKIREEEFDLLILDFLMEPIHGDKVVEIIRQFNKELYILLLTGYKDIAPPLETIKSLDIQGYCEKEDNFDQLILLIESAIKSVTQRKTLKKIENGLKSILDSAPKIYKLQSINEMLRDILSKILPIVNSKNAFILVDNIAGNEKESRSFFEGVGQYDDIHEKLMKTLSPELLEGIGIAKMSKRLTKTGKGIVLPLLNGNSKTLGVVYIESSDLSFETDILKIYATQAATSINNLFLHSMLNLKNDELDKTYKELKQRYTEAIQVLRLAVDAKDVYTRGHSDRVVYYSVKIGRALMLSEEDIDRLITAGTFHDIGKVGIPDEILFKTEKLTEEEFAEIKKHPMKGAHILSAVSMFKDVVPLVKHHHERIDGKGYPMGLKGDEIPFLARIISVADAFDAMTSDRQYRSKLKLDDAIKQLISNSGTQFDSQIVDSFLTLLNDYDKMKEEMMRFTVTEKITK